MENREFINAVNPETPPPKKAVVEQKSRSASKGKQVLVDNSVIFIYQIDETDNYENIKTLSDVMTLHSAKPNVLLGIKPALYSAFMSADGNINTYVKVGDKVRYKNPKQADIETNPVRTISSVYFKSLTNMSVVVAEFEEGDFALTYLLTKVNEN